LSLAPPLRWIASCDSTSRHAPWGHRPQNVSLRLEGLRVQILLTGFRRNLRRDLSRFTRNLGRARNRRRRPARTA
jgi:hypothetical protein